MKFFIFVWTLAFISTVYAYDPSCSKKGTIVIFSNGVDSSEFQARRHLRNVSEKQDFLNPKIDKKYSLKDRPKHVLYELRYNIRNQDNGLNEYVDFLRTTKFLVTTKLRQLSGTTPSEEEVMGFVANGVVYAYEAALLVTAPAVSIALFVAEEIANYQAGVIAQDLEAPNEINIGNMLELYRGYLNDDIRILALTHGDGNLYNNEAYNRLFDARYGANVPDPKKKDIFSSVHIAPLTDMFSEKGVYRRFYGDRFYRKIFLPFGSSIVFPAANLCVPPLGCGAAPIADSPNFHNFTITYLDFLPVGMPTDADKYNGTIGGIIEAAEMLESTCGKPPVAIFTYKKNPTNPMKYTFDATDSTDPDEQDPNDPNPLSESPDFDILTFDWYVDGLKVISGINPQFTFAFEGEHSVKLVVTDREGNANEEESMQIINATNQAPVANFLFVVDGLKTSFNSSESFDPDGEINEYFWDFGDGLFSSERLPTHTYLASGTYMVTLTVTDNNGKTGTFQSQVEVKGAEVGCFKDGKFFPGKKGSMGGFIADTATVGPDVILVGSEVCERSQVSGSVTMFRSRINGNSVVAGKMIIFDSTMNNSTVTTTMDARISNAIINDSTITSRVLTISSAEILGVTANARDVTVRTANVKNSSLSGDLRIDDSEVLNSSLSDLSLSYSFIQFSTMVGSSVYESHVETSTITGSYIEYSTLKNMTLNYQSCMNVSVSGGTTCPSL